MASEMTTDKAREALPVTAAGRSLVDWWNSPLPYGTAGDAPTFTAAVVAIERDAEAAIRAEYEDERDVWRKLDDDAYARLRAAEAKLAALRPYLRHKIDCRPMQDDCSCGLLALAATEAER